MATNSFQSILRPSPTNACKLLVYQIGESRSMGIGEMGLISGHVLPSLVRGVRLQAWGWCRAELAVFLAESAASSGASVVRI